MGMMHKCKTLEEKRASCHVEADILVNQSITDTRGCELSATFDLIRWRLGEYLSDIGYSVDCHHSDSIEAKMTELESYLSDVITTIPPHEVPQNR